MDIRHALAAMDLFHRLARQGRTIIAVLHDLNLAARCDTLTALKDGTAHSHGPARETLTSNLIEKVFGVSTTVTEHPQSRYPLLIFNQN